MWHLVNSKKGNSKKTRTRTKTHTIQLSGCSRNMLQPYGMLIQKTSPNRLKKCNTELRDGFLRVSVSDMIETLGWKKGTSRQ